MRRAHGRRRRRARTHFLRPHHVSTEAAFKLYYVVNFLFRTSIFYYLHRPTQAFHFSVGHFQNGDPPSIPLTQFHYFPSSFHFHFHRQRRRRRHFSGHYLPVEVRVSNLISPFIAQVMTTHIQMLSLVASFSQCLTDCDSESQWESIERYYFINYRKTYLQDKLRFKSCFKIIGKFNFLINTY